MPPDYVYRGNAPHLSPAETARLLTPVRRRILLLSANGKSRCEIAKELRIKETTVKEHLRMINQRLGTNDRTHAVAVALKLKLISADDIEHTSISVPWRSRPNKDRTNGETTPAVDR